MPIRFFDMFAGIGGFRSGLEAVGGYKCIGHCEIDKYANQAYNAIVMKTGTHPFISKLKLFFKWGISFPENSYTIADKGARRVHYISRETLIKNITARYPQEKKPRIPAANPPSGGQTMTEPAEATFAQEVNHAAQQEKIAKPIRTG